MMRDGNSVKAWLERVSQVFNPGGADRWEGFPPLPALNAGFVLLLAMDLAAAFVAYHLSYVARSLSTLGIFQTALRPDEIASASHAPLAIALLQMLAVWVIGGYRPGVRVYSRPFLIRLGVVCVLQSALLMPLYDVLFGPRAFSSVFPIYTLLDPAFFLLGRLIYSGLLALRQGGMALLSQLPKAIPRSLPRFWLRKPVRVAVEERVNYLEQVNHLLDGLEAVQRGRAALNARADERPPELVKRLAAEYESRAAQLRMQLSVALGGLRRQVRSGLQRSGGLRDEMIRLEAQAVELQLRLEIGELDTETCQQRENERLAALEACQKELDAQQALLADIQPVLQRAWAAAPELTPPARKTGPPEGDWDEQAELPFVDAALLRDLGEGVGVRAVQNWIESAYERLPLVDRVIQYLVHNPGAFFIVGFQVLLIICAFLLIAKQEKAAENLANVAYLSLVAGVGINLVQTVRESWREGRTNIARGQSGEKTPGIRAWWARLRQRFPGGQARLGQPASQLGGASLVGSSRLQWARRILVVAGAGIVVLTLSLVIWQGRVKHANTPGFIPSGSQVFVYSTKTASSSLAIGTTGQPTSRLPTAASPSVQAKTVTSTHTPNPSFTPTPISTLHPSRTPIKSSTAFPSPFPTVSSTPPAITPSTTAAQSPAASTTPGASTPTLVETPRPAPSLLSPDSGATLAGPVTLLWFWPLKLGADEQFEVRVWKAGQAVESLTYTQESYFIWIPTGPGTYNWQIAIVKLQGIQAVESGPPSPIRQLIWAGK